MVVIVAILYHSVLTNKYARDFARTPLGMSEAAVINLMGKPTHQERKNQTYTRYASNPCTDTCEIRLWWEAPLLPGLEAWSVEFDASGKSIHKSHWVSP
jgi:hypothetical protein